MDALEAVVLAASAYDGKVGVGVVVGRCVCGGDIGRPKTVGIMDSYVSSGDSLV